MEAKRNRVTVIATKEMEALLFHAKKTWFYDRSQSAMLRELVAAGLDSQEKKDRAGTAAGV